MNYYTSSRSEQQWRANYVGRFAPCRGLLSQWPTYVSQFQAHFFLYYAVHLADYYAVYLADHLADYYAVYLAVHLADYYAVYNEVQL